MGLVVIFMLTSAGDWTTDTTLRNILDTVYGLLFQAEASDAM